MAQVQMFMDDQNTNVAAVSERFWYLSRLMRCTGVQYWI